MVLSCKLVEGASDLTVSGVGANTKVGVVIAQGRVLGHDPLEQCRRNVWGKLEEAKIASLGILDDF